jgi:hypothetical protein
VHGRLAVQPRRRFDNGSGGGFRRVMHNREHRLDCGRGLRYLGREWSGQQRAPCLVDGGQDLDFRCRWCRTHRILWGPLARRQQRAAHSPCQLDTGLVNGGLDNLPRAHRNAKHHKTGGQLGCECG